MLEDDTLEEMRQRLCDVFRRSTSRAMSSGVDGETSRRKLVLHFDVNKTLVAVDSATGETVQDALNVYLSGMAWGKDREGCWEGPRGAKPSHTPTDSDLVSFYKFEENRLLRQLSRDRSTFRNYLSSFTDKPQGSNFKPYLMALLAKLKWSLPYNEQEHKDLTVPGTENCRYHFIMPGFYKLLNHLVQEDRDFSIIFRTYGSDAKQVMKSIRSAITRDMPFCHNLKTLLPKISESMFMLTRGENGLFKLVPEHGYEHLDTESDGILNGTSLKSDREMYSVFSRTSGICAVQDDVRAWYQHDFHPSKGKPMWVDPVDPNVQHIFFDDNIRPGVADSIVNLRVQSSPDTFRNVDRAEEHKFVHKHLVPVVLSEAIMDTDYFINELERCERNYSEHLESKYS